MHAWNFVAYFMRDAKMSAEKFCALLHEAKFGKNDTTWFPRWIRRYASSVKALEGRDLPVSEADVLQFSRSLLNSGTPAWQRLQGVRAVEAYRDLVLKICKGPANRKSKIS